MKASDLRAVWEAPDNSRLMKKQTSVRLATHIGARIEAIARLYPSKTKSQVINDLLASALTDFENGFEFLPGDDKDRELDYDVSEHSGEFREVIIEPDVGKRREYLTKANEFLVEFEKEIGNDKPKLFQTVRWREVCER